MKSIIRSDSMMMSLLACVRDLDLPDWYIGAGFVRNKVWDTISVKKNTRYEDIDVIYFDRKNLSEARDRHLEKTLSKKYPGQKWSVKNQARMHQRNGDRPYRSSADAIQYWPETVTTVAVTLGKRGALKTIAPYGLRDLFNFRIKPTPPFMKKMDIFHQRQKQKNWRKKWKQITFIFP